MLSDRCLSCLSVLSVCNVGVLWPNGWMDQDATWYGGRPRPRTHCVEAYLRTKWHLDPSNRLATIHIVLDETQLPHGKRQSSPTTFRPMSIVCGQTVARLSSCCMSSYSKLTLRNYMHFLSVFKFFQPHRMTLCPFDGPTLQYARFFGE